MKRDLIWQSVAQGVNSAFTRKMTGMGALGWNDVAVTYGCSSRRAVCGVPSAEGAWLESGGCVRQTGLDCRTTAGNDGEIYCCPPNFPLQPVTSTPTSTSTTSTSASTFKDPGLLEGGGWGVGIGGGEGTTQPFGACGARTVPGGTTYWRGIQEILCARGINPGPIDGIYGPQTAQGIKNYQASVGLPQTGIIDSATASRLGVQTSTGRSTGRSGSTTPPTPQEQEEILQASVFTDFFNLRNPIFWLAVAGILLTGAGMSYGVAKTSAGKDKVEAAKGKMAAAKSEYAGALGGMSDEGLEEYIYERAASAGVLSKSKRKK